MTNPRHTSPTRPRHHGQHPLTTPRNPTIAITVIDRPHRDGDHLFITTHHNRPTVGAIPADWQHNPQRRAQSGLAEDAEPGANGDAESYVTGVVEVSRQPMSLGDLVFYNVEGRPMFEAPAGLLAGVGDHHGQDDVVDQIRNWYQAAWTVVAMTQFIDEVVDVREAMLRTNREHTADFQDIELELSQARMAITQAKGVLAKAKE